MTEKYILKVKTWAPISFHKNEDDRIIAFADKPRKKYILSEKPLYLSGFDGWADHWLCKTKETLEDSIYESLLCGNKEQLDLIERLLFLTKKAIYFQTISNRKNIYQNE